MRGNSFFRGDDRLETLERAIRQGCNPQSWYTHLLLTRLQEDRLMSRTPAVFRGAMAHIASYAAPFLLINALLLAAMAQSHSWAMLHTLMRIDAVLAPVYAAVAQMDWLQLRRVQVELRLPRHWKEYRARRAGL